MQKKLLVTLISSAFAGVAGVAHAGPISVGSVNTYASEGLANATTVTVANLAYQLTNPIADNATGKFTYTLDAGVSAASPPTTGNCPTLAPITGLTLGAVSISTDGKTCRYPFTATAPVPSDTILSFTGGKSDGVSTLASAGKIVATVNVLDSTGSPVAGEGNSATVALSANAFILEVVNSASYTKANSGQTAIETSKLDVTATPPASAFTNEADVTPADTTNINVGLVNLSDKAGLLGPDGNAFDLTTVTNESLVVTVGGPLVAGSTVSLRPNADCTGGPLATKTLLTAASTVKLTIAAPATTAGTTYRAFACYTAPGSSKVMDAGQFTLSATYDSKYLALDNSTVTLTSTPVYELVLNGARVILRNWVPTVQGWFSAARIINTGRVAAPVRAQYINADTGAAIGTSQAVTATLQPGAVAVINSGQLEAILGAPTGSNNPRLDMVINSDGLVVQHFACQPNGNCFLNTDGQQAVGGQTSQ